MENTANWRTESRTVYSNDFKLRIVELASQPDANVAKIAREMELLTTSFLSGCACGKTRGGYHVACLRPSPQSSELSLLPVEIVSEPPTSDNGSGSVR
jgi:transposase